MYRKLLTIIALGAVTLFAAPGLRVFHIGNSLTDQAYGMHDIAKGKGYTPIVWGRFMIPGAPIHWCWSHPGNADVTGANITGGVVQVLQNNSWDALILQLYALNGDDAQTMTESGGNFAQAAYQGNPNCQVYVFGSYPERGDNWTTKVPQLNKLAVDGAAGISARFPSNKKVLVIPVMQVYDSIRIAISKGQAGSVTTWDSMFIADGHSNHNGDYLEAIVHFSTIYKADPHGSIISNLYFWAGNYGVTQSFATAVWDAAWKIIRTYPQSGVTATSVIPPAGNDVSPARTPETRATVSTLLGRSIASEPGTVADGAYLTGRNAVLRVLPLRESAH